MHEGFTHEELLSMQRRDEADRRAAIDREIQESIDRANRPDPDGYARAIDVHALQVSIEDIADILQMANGADNLFMQQCTVPTHQQRVTKEFYDTVGA
ncbi:hypothetical protein DY000_02039743 [Brassica cretica]|uniref:Uncharacterized protein n=1 Tax=Brassica cretica TaxID=69181 RepID=A0ABQ7B8F3_BRACR|nr:hypothetical protein DY000_02039743 [Brassica cretica]